MSHQALPTYYFALSEGEEQYLDALSVLVEAYEREQSPFSTVARIDAVRHVLEENGLRQIDLPDVFETRSVTSEIIKGEASAGHGSCPLAE